jgi:phosphoserine phosphatase
VAGAAAFFDLDRTLMAGSSGLHWARAAYRAGLVGRRQMASDGWSNIKFRLRGSTDEETEQVKERLGEFLEGRRVKDLERLGHQVLAGVLPRIFERMLQTAFGDQD